jgi:hypothetical protein
LAEQSTIEIGQTVVEGHKALTLRVVEHVADAIELLAVGGEVVVGATACKIILGLANNNTHKEKERDNSGELHLEYIRCSVGGFV